jgi:hypothetical protein
VPDDQRRPIKVVLPQERDFRDPDEHGGGFEPLCTVNDDYRHKYAEQVQHVRESFRPSLATGLPAVAKIVLKDSAQKKSYRPTEILNKDTCPVIGVTRAGVLLASVTSEGLDNLESRILTADSKDAISHLSTLQEIEPFSEDDSLSRDLRKQDDPNAAIPSLKVKLFRHGDSRANARLEGAFERYAQESGVQVLQAVRYGRSMKVYKCTNTTAQTARRLARFVGAQSVSRMPTVRLVRTASRHLEPITSGNFPPPDPHVEYPVVGIFDTGTDRSNTLLQEWVVGRLDCHPAVTQDNSHGSFVAGLIANSRHLNNGDFRFPTASAKIVDVVVFNDSYESEEADLLMFIEDGLKAFPDVHVWNLSLAGDDPCNDDMISDFGSTLDDLQAQYGVLFVAAAGNISSMPYRRWPVDPAYAVQDRMAPPGDSVRSITVGGLAHLENDRTCARRENPSPFSRRGPGLGGSIKPELSHYSGNCDESGNFLQTGIISVNGERQLAEDIGVSFGTPLVTVVAGGIDAELRGGSESGVSSLVKAMMVHSAFVANHPISADDIEYTGIGRPPDVGDILNCRESAATIVFQVPVERVPRFYKHPFPMPPCLVKDGILKCEVFMTLLYDPPLDRSFGIEYCRRNVIASLGFLDFDEDTGVEKYSGRQVHPSPKNLRQRYPNDLADLGLEWSPLKLYYRKFTRTAAGRRWRLSVRVLNRAECHDEEPIPVHLLVTIRSPDPDDPVYTEMVREMNAQGWIVQNLAIRSQERERLE